MRSDEVGSVGEADQGIHRPAPSRMEDDDLIAGKDCEHQAKRRQQAPYASLVEGPKRDSSVCLPLLDQHIRDQVARENEEEVDAELPCLNLPAMCDDDTDNRYPSKAVERRDSFHTRQPIGPKTPRPKQARHER